MMVTLQAKRGHDQGATLYFHCSDDGRVEKLLENKVCVPVPDFQYPEDPTVNYPSLFCR